MCIRDRYETADPSVATVTVTGKDAVEATETYTPANNVTCNTLISDDSRDCRAVSGYYYQAPDGNYYQLYAKRDSDWKVFWTCLLYTSVSRDQHFVEIYEAVLLRTFF